MRPPDGSTRLFKPVPCFATEQRHVCAPGPGARRSCYSAMVQPAVPQHSADMAASGGQIPLWLATIQAPEP